MTIFLQDNEPNGDNAHAFSVTVSSSTDFAGNGSVDGISPFNDFDDYYKFHLTNSATLVVSVNTTSDTSNGSAKYALSGATSGVLFSNATGSRSIALQPDDYYLTISDTRSNHPAPQTYTVQGSFTISGPINHAPVANNDSYSTPFNTVLNVGASGVLANDTDQDGNALTVSSFTNPGHGTVQAFSNGSFTYTPSSGYSGPDSFTYVARDGSLNSGTATVSITVGGPLNRAPVANNDSYSTPFNTALTIAASGVLANDTDQDGNSLTVSSVSNPGHGTLQAFSNGSFTYTPNSGYSGPDSFTYFANDGTSNSLSAATVSITVGGATNRAPVANNDSYSTPFNTVLNVAASGVLANDTDQDGNSLTVSSVSNPGHGALQAFSNGSFTYTPNSGYSGPDSFTYFASDGTSNSLSAATVSITVNAFPSVSIGDVSITEGNFGTKFATFTVTRSGGSTAFDVNFATSNGSATTADQDYGAKAGTLHFDAGVNAQTISVIIAGDTKIEANETFFVNLSGATNGAIISDGLAIGTIVDDDGNHLRDFNADTQSDLLWRNDNGAVATWDMHDRGFGAAVIANVSNAWHIAGTGDFNGDRMSDIVWRNDSGAVATWDMSDRSFGSVVIANVSNDWHIAGTGDFNGDGKSDILWRNDSGAVATWDMNDRSFGSVVIANVSNDWHIAGTGDFNGDGKSDILWRNDSGAVATWNMHDRSFGSMVIANVSNDWHIAGTGDFNGDGNSDIVWRNDNGAVATWDMNDRSYGAAGIANTLSNWHIAGTGDFNGDGNSDIVWRSDSGAVSTWDMYDRSYSEVVIATVPTDWHIV